MNFQQENSRTGDEAVTHEIAVTCPHCEEEHYVDIYAEVDYELVVGEE